MKNEPKGSDPTAITSSTHRREHARLTRRMERIDPVQFPNMAKLWSGARKDWLYVHEIKCYNTVCVFYSQIYAQTHYSHMWFSVCACMCLF